MKKICITLMMFGTLLACETAYSQTSDTTKNRIEIKKKVKVGAHGRQVTKIKMEGKGTPTAISGAAEGAVTGKSPEVAAPRTNPTVVVVAPQAPAPAVSAPAPASPEPKQMPVTTTHTTTTSEAHVAYSKTSKPVYHKTYRRKPVSSSSKRTTTTTTKKEGQ